MKRTVDSIRDLWENIKHTNIRIIGVLEEEEKKKCMQIFWSDYNWKFPQRRRVNSQSNPRSTKSIACQASLFMGFSRQQYWSELPCPPPGDLPSPGIDPTSLMSPTLAGRFFTTSITWEAQTNNQHPLFHLQARSTCTNSSRPTPNFWWVFIQGKSSLSFNCLIL